MCGGSRVSLGVERQRGGPRDGEPVVQDTGNMHDLRGLKLLCAAQDQVVVLAALEPAPKASEIAREIGPDGREVADIVLAAQQVGIPIRLEVRIESSPLRIDLDRKSTRLNSSH